MNIVADVSCDASSVRRASGWQCASAMTSAEKMFTSGPWTYCRKTEWTCSSFRHLLNQSRVMSCGHVNFDLHLRKPFCQVHFPRLVSVRNLSSPAAAGITCGFKTARHASTGPGTGPGVQARAGPGPRAGLGWAFGRVS